MSNDKLIEYHNTLRRQVNALPDDPFGSPEALKISNELEASWEWYCERLAQLREEQRAAEHEIGYMLDVLSNQVRDYKPTVECECCHLLQADNDNGLCDGCDSDRIKMEMSEASHDQG